MRTVCLVVTSVFVLAAGACASSDRDSDTRRRVEDREIVFPCDPRVSPVEVAHVDDDGRVDAITHTWDALPEGDDGPVLRVCSGNGTVEEIEGSGQAEMLQVIDVELDGRAEILFGGTTVSAARYDMAVMVGDALEVVTANEEPLSVWQGALEHDDSGNPTQLAEFGCEDGDGDGRRELAVTRLSLTETAAKWSTDFYEIRGTQAVLEGTRLGSGPRPPADASLFDFARSLVPPC